MASALIGALLQAGCRPADIAVVDPGEAARERLRERFGVLNTLASAGPSLAGCRLAVWAVKPPDLPRGCGRRGPNLGGALHLKRGRRHPLREHAGVAGQRPHRAHHAQHTGAGRAGDDRGVCPAR